MKERRDTERRANRVGLRYPEQRSGFDRRMVGGAITWYRDHPRVIAAALVGVVLLNLADLLLTVRALGRGASEANPIMAAMFETSPALAGSFKLLIGLGVVLVMWQLRRYRRILEVSLVALVGFSAILAYQLALVVTGA